MSATVDLIKQHPAEVSLALAFLVGTLGNVIADSVDGERYPRTYQFGRFMQNIGLALPKAIERLGCFFKAIKGQGKPPSSGSTPVPPGAGSTPLLALIFVLVIGLVTQACGHGAQACAVVDIAAESCKVVRYLGPDGTVEELTPDDLAKVAAAKRAARKQAAVSP